MARRIDLDNLHLFNIDQQILYLQRIIISETEKEPSDIDFDLIDECSLLISELQDKIPCEKTEEEQSQEIKNIIEIAKTHYKTKELSNSFSQKNSTEKNNKSNDFIYTETDSKSNENAKHKGFSIKKLFIIAVAALLMTGLSMSFAGADSPFRFRNMKFLDTHIDDISPGETISKGNQTLTRANKSATYYSAQEMVTAEQLDGIYFPKDLEIKSLNYAVFNEKIDVNITPLYQTKVFSALITSTDKFGIELNIDTYKKTTTEKGIEVWEYDKGEKLAQFGRYQLMFKINDWYYCIDTSDTEKGYELIDTFAEVTIE